eukprot:gene7953-biopygen1549
MVKLSPCTLYPPLRGGERCSGEGGKFQREMRDFTKGGGFQRELKEYPVVTSGLADFRSFQRRPRYPGTPNEHGATAKKPPKHTLPFPDAERHAQQNGVLTQFHRGDTMRRRFKEGNEDGSAFARARSRLSPIHPAQFSNRNKRGKQAWGIQPSACTPLWAGRRSGRSGSGARARRAPPQQNPPLMGGAESDLQWEARTSTYGRGPGACAVVPAREGETPADADRARANASAVVSPNRRPAESTTRQTFAGMIRARKHIAGGGELVCLGETAADASGTRPKRVPVASSAISPWMVEIKRGPLSPNKKTARDHSPGPRAAHLSVRAKSIFDTVSWVCGLLLRGLFRDSNLRDRMPVLTCVHTHCWEKREEDAPVCPHSPHGTPHMESASAQAPPARAHGATACPSSLWRARPWEKRLGERPGRGPRGRPPPLERRAVAAVQVSFSKTCSGPGFFLPYSEANVLCSKQDTLRKDVALCPHRGVGVAAWGAYQAAQGGRRRCQGPQDSGAGVARAWRGRGAGYRHLFWLGWRGRGAGMARAWRGLVL